MSRLAWSLCCAIALGVGVALVALSSGDRNPVRHVVSPSPTKAQGHGALSGRLCFGAKSAGARPKVDDSDDGQNDPQPASELNAWQSEDDRDHDRVLSAIVSKTQLETAITLAFASAPPAITDCVAASGSPPGDVAAPSRTSLRSLRVRLQV